jgi:hypothetical protein
MSSTLTCSEAISTTVVNGVDVPTCSSGWVQSLYIPPFDPSQIDPLVCTQLFGAGFLLYLTPWATAWGLTQLVKAIR